MNTFELWREHATGELWAVHLVAGFVVGCSGPLPARDGRPEELRSLEYSGERAEWVESHRDSFDLAEPAGVRSA